jgi:hypothetical protein
MKYALAALISFLFPPKLGLLRQPYEFMNDSPDEQGFCGRAQTKPFRDAIDRHWRTL